MARHRWEPALAVSRSKGSYGPGTARSCPLPARQGFLGGGRSRPPQGNGALAPCSGQQHQRLYRLLRGGEQSRQHVGHTLFVKRLLSPVNPSRCPPPSEGTFFGWLLPI